MFPLLLIAGLVFFFVYPMTEAGSMAMFLFGEITKGARVGTKSTSVDSVEIAENPEDLAASADLDIETYTGARVISSEEGNSPVLHQLCVGWALLNVSRSKGATVFEYSTDGSFGRQGTGRPVSTWQDPYAGHVKIFQAIVNGEIADPTSGAVAWIAPASQDVLHVTNPAKYKSFETVNASRLADGFIPVTIDGVNPRLLTMYRRG